LLPATLLWLAAVPSASAQDASNWDGQKHSAARLIAGATSRNHDASFLRAGIEIKLDPGWHTYWRDPGDSGAPPSFDFSGSENVKSVNVLWPAPERFPDGAGGNSIGYHNHVVLPLHVVAVESEKQTALRLKLAYDVCSNICIPVESNLVLSLGGDGAEDQAIARAEFRVPRPVALGQPAHADAIGERTQANTLASKQASAQYSAKAQAIRAAREKKAAGTARRSPFSVCIVSRATRMIASSSMSRRPWGRRWTSLSRVPLPIGRYRCRNKARPMASCGISNSSSMVCHPIPKPKARR